jgi:squalene synthase HpnC
MTVIPFAAELALYGPDRPTAAISPTDARAYCRRLARTHYENFTVASWLLPRELRQHFHNIYAYCRWADDLADETGDAGRSLELLDWWEGQLRNCYAGLADDAAQTGHPVFVALRDTIRQFDIPIEPLADLLVAFRQDQRVKRYETRDELVDYCRYSANPVGRLVLYLGRCHDEDRGRLSDEVCTGLQLANFCQDVARDWDRGRIYLPQAACRAAGYDLAMFQRRETNAPFRELLADQVDEAEGHLRRGAPLTRLMPRALAADVALFIEGGLAILRGIRQIGYDVWRVRPVVARRTQLALLARCVWRGRFGRESR